MRGMFKLIMEKRAGCPSVYATKHKKPKRANHMEEDRISQLPDDILVCILSLLTLKEAARTSALARRWRKVWISIRVLNFDASQTLNSLFSERDSVTESRRERSNRVRREKRRYVKWVNRFLDAYQGHFIDEFRIKFWLNRKYRSDIDRWFSFAIENKVKRLVMDFPNVDRSFRFNLHAFPLLSSPNCRFLMDLTLNCVNISGDVIECFISRCPNLERLSIDGSDSLVDLNIAGPSSLCLKHLEIQYCFNLKSIYISGTNLLSFKYRSQRVGITFSNGQNFVELSVGGISFDDIMYNFDQLSNCISRLEALSLSSYKALPNNVSGPLFKFPTLPHLKKLRLKICAKYEDSLLGIAPVIEGAPFLCSLVLDLHCFESSKMIKKRAIEGGIFCPHQCLKFVEIFGFVGRAIDMEFAEYLIKNAIMLERFIIDPLRAYMIGKPWSEDTWKSVQATRKHVMLLKLESRFSLGNKLVLRNF